MKNKNFKEFNEDRFKSKIKLNTVFVITIIFILFGFLLASCGASKEVRDEKKAYNKVYSAFKKSRKGTVRATSELFPVDTSSKVSVRVDRIVDTFTLIDSIEVEGDCPPQIIRNNYIRDSIIINRDSFIIIPDKTLAEKYIYSNDSLKAEYNILDKKLTKTENSLKLSKDINIITCSILVGIIIFIIVRLYLKSKTKLLP